MHSRNAHEEQTNVITSERCNMTEKILRLARVIEVTGLSRSSIFSMIKDGTLEFPQPIRLGKRAIGWKHSEIQAWLSDRPTLQQGDQE